MTTTKTLFLAAFAALSLGVGAAQAQSLAPSSAEGTYYQNQTAPANVNRGSAQVQAGSSDVNPDTGADHSPEFIYSHHLFGAGGVGG